MFRFLHRREELARKLESLIRDDLDRAVEEFAAQRRRLRADDRTRLATTLRRRLQARDSIDFLSRGLAEGTITAVAASELLETYQEAGYLEDAELEMLRRHVVDAYRRELTELLRDDHLTSSDYFSAVDSYRAVGYLSEAELEVLQGLIDAKLDPALAARRLFAAARTQPALDLQEEMLERYLLEFEGFPDFPEAASLYLSLRIDHLWKVLPAVRYAREAVIAVHELNSLLIAHLPYTDDISDEIPVDRIVQDFMRLAGEFKPEPDIDGTITARHLRRGVVIASKQDAPEGTYEHERNSLVSIGAKGRVVAARENRVMVSLQGSGLAYSRSWPQPAFKGTQYAKIHPKSSLASWAQSELGLVKHRRPSPVFVHQYREAVKRMADLLEQHRKDNTPLIAPSPAPALPPGEES